MRRRATSISVLLLLPAVLGSVSCQSGGAGSTSQSPAQAPAAAAPAATQSLSFDELGAKLQDPT